MLNCTKRMRSFDLCTQAFYGIFSLTPMKANWKTKFTRGNQLIQVNSTSDRLCWYLETDSEACPPKRAVLPLLRHSLPFAQFLLKSDWNTLLSFVWRFSGKSGRSSRKWTRRTWRRFGALQRRCRNLLRRCSSDPRVLGLGVLLNWLIKFIWTYLSKIFTLPNTVYADSWLSSKLDVVFDVRGDPNLVKAFLD